MIIADFYIKGPIPRTAPYKKFRSHLYVPADVKKWRSKIAKAFSRLPGFKSPEAGERVMVDTTWKFIKNHCDVDSIYHSLQDALSKDALHVSDKHWSHTAIINWPFVDKKAQEGVHIVVVYTQA